MLSDVASISLVGAGRDASGTKAKARIMLVLVLRCKI
jgi:hypothetical protein